MKILTLFCFLFIFPSISNASNPNTIKNGECDDVACSINQFHVNLNYCDLNEAFYYFELDVVDFGTNGFTITLSNGMVFNFTSGTEGYFSFIPNCTDEIFATLTDNNNPSCSMTVSLGIACCPCYVNNMLGLQATCDNNIIYSDFYLEIEGYCYFPPVITVNNTNIAYTQIEDHFILEPFNSHDEMLTYVICYSIPNMPPTCREQTIPNPCYPRLFSFEAIPDTSTCSNDSLLVSFSFEGENFGRDGFIVSSITGNDQYYTLNDPYIYKIPADCNEPVLLTIYDYNVDKCFLSVELPPLCCPCKINTKYRISQCKDDKFDLTLEVNELNSSCQLNNYSLLLGKDTLQYTDSLQFILANDITSHDSLLYFDLVSFNLVDTLHYRDTLQNPCFQPTLLPCKIQQFSVAADSAACTLQSINLHFDVAAINFGNLGYIVTSNHGFAQTYSNSDPKNLQLIADCNQDIVFTITDLADSLCAASYSFGLLCCPCVFDYNLSTTACTDDKFQININIGQLAGSCANYDFQLMVNGQSHSLSKTNTGYISSPISAQDSLIYISVCDLVPGAPSCYFDTIVNPCYQSPPPMLCSVNNFALQADASQCSGELIQVGFSYTATNFGTNGYIIKDNGGRSYSFAAADQKVLTLIADCAQSYTFTIFDANDSLCLAQAVAGPLCCDCEAAFTIQSGPCVDKVFSLEIHSNISSGSCINYDWTLSVNQQPKALKEESFGWSVSNLNSADSLLVLNLCNLVPALPECFAYTIVNPCYEMIINTEVTDHFADIKLNALDKNKWLIENRSDEKLNYSIHTINGLTLDQPKPLKENSSIIIDANHWPTGIYFIHLQKGSASTTRKFVITY